VQLDPWLEPFTDALRKRYSKAQQWIKLIDEHEGGLEKFSRVSSVSVSRRAAVLYSHRDTNASVSTFRATEIYFIENGHPMLCELISLATSVCSKATSSNGRSF